MVYIRIYTKDVQLQQTSNNTCVEISSDLHAILEMASSAKKCKGVTKELSTFLKWGKDDIIGYTVETLDNKQYVTKIWCRLCADLLMLPFPRLVNDTLL